ncbi:hypothetical protein Aperf_G00000126126 [Anoplocephala perfoliata]
MLVSGLRGPAYQEIAEDEPGDVPRRRPMARNLKDRVTNIVSMYVPNGPDSDTSQLKHDLVEDGDVTQMNDHFGLLSLGELENKIDSGGLELCHITPQIDRGSLFTSVINELRGSNYRIDLADFKISCLATDGTYLYFGVESLPFLFKLHTVDFNSLENGGQCSVKKIHLKTVQLTDIIPTKLCLNDSHGETSEIYVIGTSLLEGSTVHLLVCYSVDGKVIAQSKKYPYERYLAIDVDFDGNLLLGCTSQSIGEAGVKDVSQICKLTPHFERRIFSITMRKAGTSYCPDSITKSCVRGHCWASVSRWEDETKRTVRRIFAFPGARPDSDLHVGEPTRSPKEWLQVISWNFESFSAGSVLALDSERLLAMDFERKSLAIITWPEGQNSASLQRITKPGNRQIECISAARASPPVAYFSSEGDIFKFVPAALGATTVDTLPA